MAPSGRHGLDRRSNHFSLSNGVSAFLYWFAVFRIIVDEVDGSRLMNIHACQLHSTIACRKVNACYGSYTLAAFETIMATIFISYRRNDSAYVARTIYERLRARFGEQSVFWDVDTIPFGVDFREQIEKSVGQCDVLVAVIGDTWTSTTSPDGRRRLDNDKDAVRIELLAAFSRNIAVIPVLVGNATMPLETELPPSLRALSYQNAAELRPGRDFEHQVQLLIKGVASQLHRARRSKAKARLPKVTLRTFVGCFVLAPVFLSLAAGAESHNYHRLANFFGYSSLLMFAVVIIICVTLLGIFIWVNLRDDDR